MGRGGESRGVRGKEGKNFGFHKNRKFLNFLNINFSRKTVFSGVVCRCTFCVESKISTKNFSENNRFRKLSHNSQRLQNFHHYGIDFLKLLGTEYAGYFLSDTSSEFSTSVTSLL